jgi:hypothetical protein
LQAYKIKIILNTLWLLSKANKASVLTKYLTAGIARWKINARVFYLKKSARGDLQNKAWEISGKSAKSSYIVCSVADPEPGSDAFLTPGSGIRNRFFPDPGSQTHIFESLVTIFWVENSITI